MAKRMLIDATHREETRVVVLNGNRLDEFDFETSTKKQLKGNIYLAKVTRVEPSLQAAFVDFGGDRHGFLAFNEIHPDYYQIPVADRMALLREEEALAAEALEAGVGVDEDYPADAGHDLDDPGAHDEEDTHAREDYPEPAMELAPDEEIDGDTHPMAGLDAGDEPGADAAPNAEAGAAHEDDAPEGGGPLAEAGKAPGRVEELGGEDSVDIRGGQRRRGRSRRQHYKIQEVIKRRQIILVQVVKEERGNKGAALTTYLSLAGRYCVLMPNTTKGGGISRKITSPKDRNRLKGFISDLDIPDGVAVILRTAAIERSKAEIRRDFEYLIRTWHLVRDTTLSSIAPTLVYEEGNLIKRSIRDLYSKDMEDVLVEGDEGYKTAKDFMRMLMPSHAKRVQPYKDPSIPLFQRYQVEPQIDAMHSPEVKLKSGGYIVINPTEALVSIDVNSGRATRERNIEETAYKTNLEAAEEIARQLKLRDLAGLIVIDFIDMMENRNQHTVERRLKDAMRSDRARIQIGRISPFGLLELSRQRLRPSLLEASTAVCPHCEGTGLIRSTESAALHVLRAIEEEGTRRRSGEIRVAVATPVALYILNEKRAMLTEIEVRHGFSVLVDGDDSLVPPAYRVERISERPAEGQAAEPGRQPEAAPARAEAPSEERPSRRRRSRRRRPRRGEEGESEAPEAAAPEQGEEAVADELAAADDGAQGAGAAASQSEDEQAAEKPKRRRRGRRGGRRQSRAKATGANTDAAEEHATAQDGTAADQDAPAEPGVDSGSTAADAAVSDEAAPAKRESRRGRATSAGGGRQTGTPDDASEGDESPALAASAEDDERGAPSPSPRKRRPRGRKKPAADSAAAPDKATASRDQGTERPGNGAGNGNGAEAPSPEPVGAGAEKPEAEPSLSPPPQSPAAEDRPPAPKRQGWWSRFSQ